MRLQRVMTATLEYASLASANAGIPRLLIMKNRLKSANAT